MDEKLLDQLEHELRTGTGSQADINLVKAATQAAIYLATHGRLTNELRDHLRAVVTAGPWSA